MEDEEERGGEAEGNGGGMREYGRQKGGDEGRWETTLAGAQYM